MASNSYGLAVARMDGSLSKRGARLFDCKSDTSFSKRNNCALKNSPKFLEAMVDLALNLGSPEAAPCEAKTASDRNSLANTRGLEQKTVGQARILFLQNISNINISITILTVTSTTINITTLMLNVKALEG